MATRTRTRRRAPATRLRGKDLKERNRKILKDLRAGDSEEVVAKRYRLSPKTVGFIRWKAGQASRRIPARA